MSTEFHSNIAVTGGSGFLGGHLLKHELFKNALAIGRTRPPGHPFFYDPGRELDDSLVQIFGGIDVAVHLAGRAHIMRDDAEDPVAEFRKINTENTLKLARYAAEAGVKRFIFISTIKVLGEKVFKNCVFRADNPLNPQDPYSLSKAEAEVGLKQLGEVYGMEIVIIRPPLIYGGNVKGNFLSLMHLVKTAIPLPFAAIHNKRSLVSVDNLVDLIAVCTSHVKAKDQVFLVSDSCDLSTPELIVRLARAGGREVRMFAFPSFILRFAAQLLGQGAVYDRLFESMQIDIEHTRSELGWSPPFTVDQSLRACWTDDTTLF